MLEANGMQVATCYRKGLCGLGVMHAVYVRGRDMKSKLNLIVLLLWHRLKSEEGQDLIEYALLVGFIGLAVISSTKPIGDIIYEYYLYIHNQLKGSSPFFQLF